MLAFNGTMDAADCVAIAALQSLYGYAVDRRDWNTFRELFTEDATAVYPGATYSSMDDFIADFVEIHNQFTVTSHAMTNHVATIDGDIAHASCYGLIELVRPGDAQMITNRTIYEDDLVRESGQWRIRTRHCYRQFRRLRPIEPDEEIGEQFFSGATILHPSATAS